MNKEEILKVMHSAFDEANKTLCLQNGMSEEDANDSIEKSTVAIDYLLLEVFKQMQEKDIVVIS
jgi:hypothetical protein